MRVATGCLVPSQALPVTHLLQASWGMSEGYFLSLFITGKNLDPRKKHLRSCPCHGGELDLSACHSPGKGGYFYQIIN